MGDTENKAEKGDDIAESSSQHELSVEDKLILTKMDRLKKVVYSQQEWEAHLLEKLEKKEKAKGNSASSKDIGLFQKLKNLFKTPQESQFFLETETKEFIKNEEKSIQVEESSDLTKTT